MPWQDRDIMSLRREFVLWALHADTEVRELCRRYCISPTTGYKWISRFLEKGEEGLRERSRRPSSSPNRTPDEVEREVLDVRKEHAAWGGRKIRARLLELGQTRVPAASTITEILRRHGKLEPEESRKRGPFVRFEHDAPNELWQMDFKGHFPVGQRRCHPLTVLDDHSRFSVGLRACPNERESTVKDEFTAILRRYGLPDRVLVDNGSPWGSDAQHTYTTFTVWLMRLGIRVTHSRPYHPQTQGKDERFHRTLKAEVLRYEQFQSFAHCQSRFDRWRHVYNYERPHEALDMKVPASCYRPSNKSFPQTLPPIEYGPQDIVRKVQQDGRITYQATEYKVGKAFKGYPVALRHTNIDGQMEVYFCSYRVAQIDLREHNRSD